MFHARKLSVAQVEVEVEVGEKTKEMRGSV